MNKAAPLADTFAVLRSMLQLYAGKMIVQVDKPGEYQLCSRSMQDRIGRPLFVASAQIRKNYVSFHLIPVYACPELLDDLSPALRKRMQGKACFNFTTIDSAQLKELAALTKKSIQRFQKVKPPWA